MSGRTRQHRDPARAGGREHARAHLRLAALGLALVAICAPAPARAAVPYDGVRCEPDCEARCEQGDLGACRRVGARALSGRLARPWFRRACEGGDTRGCAEYFEALVGSDEEVRTERRWASGRHSALTRERCSAGDLLECARLGRERAGIDEYADTWVSGSASEREAKPLLKDALDLARPGCDAGYTEACILMGRFHEGFEGGRPHRRVCVRQKHGGKYCWAAPSGMCDAHPYYLRALRLDPEGDHVAAHLAKRYTVVCKATPEYRPPGQRGGVRQSEDGFATGAARGGASGPGDDPRTSLEGDEARAARLPRCPPRGCGHGRGRLVLPDGSEYAGDWHDGKPHGQGVMRSRDGALYSGGVVGGLRDGRGRMRFASGNVYTGQWARNQPNGRGEFLFKNGSRYRGEMRAGQMHGQGRLELAGGEVYEGEFGRGRMEGHGTWTEADGASWTGPWRGGVQDGPGTWSDADGNTRPLRYQRGRAVRTR